MTLDQLKSLLYNAGVDFFVTNVDGKVVSINLLVEPDKKDT